MINDIITDAKQRMGKCSDVLKSELTKLRTGRAHPSLLEHLTVEYYGSAMPLNQVASVSVSDPRTLLVTPWDKAMVQAVEKSIQNADLGLNPATAGTAIRVPMPPLTEERRRSLTKLVRSEGENAKVSIRNVRRDANAHVKDLLKSKDITEDDARRAEEQIQKITDSAVSEIEALLTQKEADIMEI